MSGQLPEVLDAGAVELRRLTGTDAPRLVEAVTESLTELGQWFEWAQTEPDVQAQRERLDQAARAFVAGDDYEFAILERATAAFVGGLRLNPHAGPHAAGIGFWVRSDRYRRGYASAATSAATAATFEYLRDIDRIEIHMDQANEASVAVARTVGFMLDREVAREILAPGHTGRGYVWVTTRDRWTRRSA